MNDWFTVEKIDDITWAISEYGHWEETHCYLLVGSTRAVLIDTGLGVENIKDVTDSLTKLPVQVILTHAHWDHMGGVEEYDTVSLHEADSQWLEHGLPIPDSVIQANFAKLPTSKPLPKSFDLSTYTTPKRKPTATFHGGELIELGDRQLEIIHTPGHSPGSICIRDKTYGYLFTGDTLYEGTLYMNYESTDPVAFANSIRRIAKLSDVKMILPGHHKLRLLPSVLTEAAKAFDKVAQENALHHGSGLHKFGKIELLI